MAWLYLPPETVRRAQAVEAFSGFPSAPEPVASILDCTSPSQTIEPWVTSSRKAMQRPLSWRGWKTRSWIKRLSGTTLPASTADRGAASWISSMVAIRANRSALQERGSVPTTRAICGRTCFGSSANASRDFAFLKMSAAIYDWDLNKSTMTFDQWVIALRQVCLRRKKLVRRISGKGCSSWLTPRAQESGETQETFLTRNNDRTNKCFGSLTAQTKKWSTPTARDWKDGVLNSPNVPTNGLLSRQAPRTLLDGINTSGIGRTLNPQFVEALMGWPIGWTDSVSAATGLSRWLPHMRSTLLHLLQA